MATDKKPTPTEKPNISISGDVKDSTVIIGDNNQTIIQKFFNIFKSDSETLEQRNRRILLNHVENAWIKGVLDASLHGAALLDLGIKQDPEAVTQYPWAIKKESTNETLPAGLSMLDIFDSIGMGRSLLILGAPGSGKTTMLLELARQLIARAREDATHPIPMVFNLSSWSEEKQVLTEKKGFFNKKSPSKNSELAPFGNWLVNELNSMYSIPQDMALDLIKENKLLLLLDGLDEVRQDSRAKCVEAINAFRKEHGLTSLSVCSRSQDYSDLEAKLSFEGAIEVQPLTQGQIAEFFNRFGDEMAGIKQALEKDGALREMAETPLFLSIMLMAYRDKQDVEILVSGDEKIRRKHLFDTYIERMFEHHHSKNIQFMKQDVLNWLLWLASKMVEYKQIHYSLESMQPKWLDEKKKVEQYKLIFGLIVGLFFGPMSGLVIVQSAGLYGLIGGLVLGVIAVLVFRSISGQEEISSVDSVSWNWNRARKGLYVGLWGGLFFAFFELIDALTKGLVNGLILGLIFVLISGLISGLMLGLLLGLVLGLRVQQVDQIAYPGQRLVFTLKNSLYAFLFLGLTFGLFWGLLSLKPITALIYGLFYGVSFGLMYGGIALIQHYILRFILARNNLLPWRLVLFLDHCVDLIFLRRVGGGYIFVHRLLMEHFATLPAGDQFPSQNTPEIVREIVQALPQRWKMGILLLTILSISLCGWAVYDDSLSGIYAIRGKISAQSGNVEGAMRDFENAATFKPSNAYYWNDYCWFGSLAGHAEEVLQSCEHAVNLEPDNGAIRDSRGLARALTEDYKGAIEDFRFFVKWTDDEKDRLQREYWIVELEAGRNPFDEEVLQSLLKE